MSTKDNHEVEPLTKAVARRQALEAAIRHYVSGDIKRARNIVESHGHVVKDDDRLADLLVEMVGEACKAVARAILRGDRG